jgi:hypothetical protein
MIETDLDGFFPPRQGADLVGEPHLHIVSDPTIQGVRKIRSHQAEQPAARDPVQAMGRSAHAQAADQDLRTERVYRRRETTLARVNLS